MGAAQPSLFEQLQAEPSPLHLPSVNNWCGLYTDLVEGWTVHGIPADLSTVQHACALLLLLWREHSALQDTMGELLEQLAVEGRLSS